MTLGLHHIKADVTYLTKQMDALQPWGYLEFLACLFSNLHIGFKDLHLHICICTNWKFIPILDPMVLHLFAFNLICHCQRSKRARSRRTRHRSDIVRSTKRYFPYFIFHLFSTYFSCEGTSNPTKCNYIEWN